MEGEDEEPPYSPPEDGGGLVEELVMSEVHMGCSPNHSGPHISRFTVFLPRRNGDEEIDDSLDSTKGKVFEVDEDGDLILTRRHNAPRDSFVVSIQHNITSSIPSVGLQVWKAELVLADFVLHMMYKSSDFVGVVAIELGAGTDKGDDVLGNCAKNISLNAGIFHRKASIHARELDWNHPVPEVVNSQSKQRYGWSKSEVVELQRASLLLAADVIYSDDLTDAFFCLLEVVMSNYPNDKVLYLALEKRYNFTMDDIDVVANGYSRFLSYIKDEEEDGSVRTSRFMGRRIDLEEIPQYVQEYDRGNDVEIWQIRYVKQEP